MNREKLASEAKIYIGLNDSETKTQKFDIGQYASVLKLVCRNYHVPFSFTVEQGGYFHENGDYTQENTLVLTLIDIEQKTVAEIARDLCAFFHQESVLITGDFVRILSIKNDIDINDGGSDRKHEK